MGMRRLALTVGLMCAIAAWPAQAQAQAQAQEQGGERGGFANMQRAGGEVTAVAGNTLTLKAPDGSVVQVVCTENTRIMKGRNQSGGTVKLSELKVGDGVMAMGNLDAPKATLHAAIVVATDAAQVKALKENLGKTYIVGKVAAIDLDNAKMTVERSDKVAQTIGFDETTSFKRGRGGRGGGTTMIMSGGAAAGAPAPGIGAAAGRDAGESITLADVKVGDEVAGQGALKAGTFVPTQLTVMTPGQGRRAGAGAPRGGTGTGPGTGSEAAPK